MIIGKKKDRQAPEELPPSGTGEVIENDREPAPELTDGSKEPDLLTCALRMAPFIKRLLGEDIGLGVSGPNTYLYYSPGKVKLAVREGDPVKEGSIAYRTMQGVSRVTARIGKEVYGLPYIGTAYPLKDPLSGESAGCVLTVTPVERQENLNALAGQMERQIETIALTTTDLSATSEELAAAAENLNSNARGIREEIKKTDGVMELIRDVAEQTHLLGLNAAIEAARAGDAGRVFSVVAGEIRKLSQDTQKSVKEIMRTLTGMQKSILELTLSIEQISAGTQQQAASAQEINSVVGELTSVAANLKEQADKLINL